MEFEPRNRISGRKMLLMLIIATAIWIANIIIDLIPFVGWIIVWLIEAAAWYSFWMWFMLSGAKLGKNKGKNIISVVVSFIPEAGGILSAFPIVIYLNIRSVRLEDKEYNAMMKAEAELQMLANQEAAQALEEAEAQENEQEEQQAIDEQEAENETEEENEAIDNKIEEQENAQNQPEEEPEDTFATVTGEDAYDQLKQKPNKTSEEERRLERANQIFQTGRLAVADRNDEVFVAAYEQARKKALEVETEASTQGMRIAPASRPSQALPKGKVKMPENIDEVGASRLTTEKIREEKRRIQPHFQDDEDSRYRDAA